MDKLPGGMLMGLQTEAGPPPKNLSGAGFSVAKEDSGMLGMKIVLGFDSESDAKNAMNKVKNSIEGNEEYENTSLQLKGKYIEFLRVSEVEEGFEGDLLRGFFQF